MVETAPTATHPLDPLGADEIRAAVAAARGSGRVSETALFSMVTLDEPTRSEVDAHRPGRPFERRVRLVIVPGPESSLVEAVVALPSAEIVRWTERDGVRPALLFDDSYRAIVALRQDPDWQQAMIERGITDFDQVQIDPWPTGNFGYAAEEGRRIARCLSYYRERPSDNGYARPVEGVLATVDAARGQVLEVLDLGVAPLPPERGSYLPEDNQPLRTDLRPLEIVQPEGVSFRLDGNLLSWQRWSMRVSMDPLEGLVLHTVGYDDDGVRPLLHRAAVSEMVVPYGDPGPMHGWKNAFDVGEWGLGRMANSLTLGCDCLGEITYLDATFASEHGTPYVLENAICIHEEDYGILWKHQDMNTGHTEVRRSRRLVVSSIATVGNYEYGFYWYFYLDGTMQLEVKLTGIMSTQALGAGEETAYGSVVAPGLAAPFHQHLFCARLDLTVDGPVNEAYEVSLEGVPTGPDNPWGNAIRQRVDRLGSELQARRDVYPATSRHWRFVNPGKTNGLGRPVAYKLVPGATPTLLAQPESSVGRRAGFARHNLWVTPYEPDERRAAGDYPNQHPGGDGLPAWTAADRSLVGTEIVAWHTFGVTHLPRPEDWPVMPVEYCGFHLVAVGFFDRNPSLDLPPPGESCH
ncbi:MAG: primary-amine oxidase [Acidimicrobiales bacterium]